MFSLIKNGFSVHFKKMFTDLLVISSNYSSQKLAQLKYCDSTQFAYAINTMKIFINILFMSYYRCYFDNVTLVVCVCCFH